MGIIIILHTVLGNFCVLKFSCKNVCGVKFLWAGPLVKFLMWDFPPEKILRLNFHSWEKLWKIFNSEIFLMHGTSHFQAIYWPQKDWTGSNHSLNLYMCVRLYRLIAMSSIRLVGLWTFAIAYVQKQSLWKTFQSKNLLKFKKWNINVEGG